MSSGQLRRLSVTVGTGVFVLALIAQFSRVDMGLALLLSVGAAVGFGLAAYLAGSVVAAARPAAAPARPEAPAPAAAEEAEYELPPLPGEEQATDALPSAPGGAAGGEKTGDAPQPGATQPGATGPDLHQTVRLDEAGVDYVLPEVSPEELFRDREGIDEEFLRQGMGIEGAAVASENTVKGTEEGGN